MQKTLPRDPNLGRNDPCSCGSGKKYKKCCLDAPFYGPIQEFPRRKRNNKAGLTLATMLALTAPNSTYRLGENSDD